jgi:hypothetical protein
VLSHSTATPREKRSGVVHTRLTVYATQLTQLFEGLPVDCTVVLVR